MEACLDEYPCSDVAHSLLAGRGVFFSGCLDSPTSSFAFSLSVEEIELLSRIPVLSVALLFLPTLLWGSFSAKVFKGTSSVGCE